MVNRTMQAKTVKRLKQMKARPRYLKPDRGYIHTSQSTDKSKIPKEYAGLFEYRSRGKTFVDDFLEAKFPSHNQVSKGRQEAIALTDRLMAMPPVQHKVMVQDGRFTKICMVKDNDCIHFIQWEVRTRQLSVSITYNNYDRAMSVFHLQTIRWKENYLIQDVELP